MDEIPLPPGRAGRAIAYALAAVRLEEVAASGTHHVLANQAREFASRLWTQAEDELEMASKMGPSRGATTVDLVKELARDDTRMADVLRKARLEELRLVLPDELQRLAARGPELLDVLDWHLRREVAPTPKGLRRGHIREIRDVVRDVLFLLRPDLEEADRG